LAEVMRLRPVAYQFNGKGGTVRDGRQHVGLVADEAQRVMPEMVGSDGGQLDGRAIKTLDATALVYALVNAVRELADRITALEAPRA
jgi:hypothetical protein